MNAGVYKATTGLLHQAARLEAITENLANAVKPGYKRTVMSTRPFTSAMQDAMAKVNYEDGVRINRVAVDFTIGPMRNTGRSLDFAIEGENTFFAIEKDGQTFYTRDGVFGVDQEGRLVNAGGVPVAGNVTIPPNTVIDNLTVGNDGTIFDGTSEIGRIELFSFNNPQNLIRVGPTLFKAPDNMPGDPAADGVKLHNRMLESSNTTIFEEMAGMIECMRNFEACQKMITIQDASEGAMINKIIQP